MRKALSNPYANVFKLREPTKILLETKPPKVKAMMKNLRTEKSFPLASQSFHQFKALLVSLPMVLWITACGGSGGGDDIVVDHASYATSAGGAFSDAATEVTTDSERNIITIGDFQETVDFNARGEDTTSSSNGSSDMFIIKQSPAGEFMWYAAIGGTENDITRGVTTDGNDNILVAGNFRETVDFDPGEGVHELTSPAPGSAFVLKLGPDGSLIWALNFESTSSNYAYDIAVDRNDNVYVTGYFNGTIDFDPGVGSYELTSTNGVDAFVAKLTPTGELIWAEQLATPGGQSYAYAVDVDADGNVFTGGFFSQTIDLDPGKGTDEHTSAGQFDAFVACLNPNGEFRWAASAGGTGNDTGRELVVDGDGYVTLMGQFDEDIDFSTARGTTVLEPIGFQGCFIAQYDPNGNLEWLSAVDSVEFTEATSITVDSDNNVYAVGAHFGSAVAGLGMDSIPLSLSGGADAFITCFSPDGVLQWAERFGDTGFEIVSAMAIDADRSVILAGHFDGTLNLPAPLKGSLNTVGYQDMFTLKMTEEDFFD